MPAPVVMVHGAFCGGWAFEAFKAPFEEAGHLCIALDLPGHHPGARPEAVLGLSITDYAKSLAKVIAACDEPPVVIGHSLGGLVAQLAAASAPVQSLVLLAPSGPWGDSSGSMEEAAVAIGLMSLGAPWFQALSPDEGMSAAYGLDRMDRATRAQTFAQMGPESGRALFETFNWWLDPFMATRVQPAAIAAPALVIAGDRDRIHGQSSVQATATRLAAELRMMPGMSHWLIGEPGWQDVAQACLTWMQTTQREVA